MVGARQNRYYKRKLYFNTQDRILLHLLQFVGLEDEIALPDAMTQFGIADGIGLVRSTVSKSIRRHIKKGLIRSARAHVPSGSLRRTVYMLTADGVEAANRRRREIEEDVVVFRDAAGSERKLRVADIPSLVPQYATILDIATHVSQAVFDLATFRPPRGKFVDFTARMPRLRYFFGRERELATIETWLEDRNERVLVITGMAGIGKTTLMARKLEDWRNGHHMFFQRILPWTTLRNIALQLSEFLARLSRKGLAQYLEATQTTDIDQIVEILAADLDGVPAVFLYDDYHNAEPAIQNFFYAFRTMLETVEGLRLVVAGRQVPPFYDRRDVRVKRLVREIVLEGLDSVSAGKLLQTRNVLLPPAELASLLRRTGGHPLFLELADFQGGSAVADIQRYLNEDLFSKITDVEARVLTFASVFRGPVPVDALHEEEGVEAATIRGLVEQSLLREVSARVYDLHDLVRFSLLEAATAKERKRFHKLAARFYLSTAEPNSLEALYHLVEAGDVTAAARLAVTDGRLILKRETQEMLAVLDRLLPKVEDAAQNLELRLLRAQALDMRGEVDGAVQVYREIVETTNARDFGRKIAEAQHRLGDIYRRLGESAAAEERLEAGLNLYHASHDASGEAEVLHALAVLAEERGDIGRAERLCDRSRALARQLGMRELDAELQVAQSRYLGHRGDHQGSLERRRHALALAESLGNWHLLAKLHISLGTAYRTLKQLEAAAQEYEQGIQIARRIGNLRMLAFGLNNVAGLYLRKEDYAHGEPCLKEASALFHKLGDPVNEAIVLLYEGTMWARRGKWGLGRAKLSESVERLRRASSPADLVKALYAFSWELHLHGEDEVAIRLIDEAIASAKRIRLEDLLGEMQDHRERYARELVAHPRRPPTNTPSPG